MLVVFFSIGITKMGIFNIFSVLIYIVGLRVGVWDNAHIAALLNSIEIILHMTMAIFFVGFSACFQLIYPVVVLAIFVVPNEQRKINYPLLVIMPAVWITARFFMAGNRSGIPIAGVGIGRLVYL